MHINVHHVAQQGFTRGANLYEQVRPSYPTEVIDFLKSLSDETPNVVVDIGAGTGKLTRLLGRLNANELIAIEPVAEMRGNLKNIPIITKIIDATAEKLPLDDHTVDILCCAEAFHWFATHSALAEFHRVLKPNGHLVLIWNSDDRQTNNGELKSRHIFKVLNRLERIVIKRWNGRQYSMIRNIFHH